jgi:hypothetical protein
MEVHARQLREFGRLCRKTMWNPDTKCFSIVKFEKQLKLHSRGLIPQSQFISDFLQSFDPDSLTDCLGMIDDDTRDRIRKLVEPSPQTECGWANLRLSHRVEADELFAKHNYKLPFGHGDRVFIVDLDWAWYSVDPPFAFRRFEIYALRSAFGLPTHECDWENWCTRNADQIARTGLNPWIFECRTRWYAYLCGGTIPRSRYENCPRPENLMLNAEESPSQSTVRDLLARIRLIDDNYPSYFFNIRRRLTDQLRDAWNIRP